MTKRTVKLFFKVIRGFIVELLALIKLLELLQGIL